MSRKTNFSEASRIMEEFLQDFNKTAAAKETPKAMSETDQVSTSQKDLGKSQSAEAKAGGGTIGDGRTVKDTDAFDSQPNKEGPQAKNSDESVAGAFTSVSKREDGLDNKIARAEALGNAVLEIINRAVAPVQKVAAIEKTAEEVVYECMHKSAIAAAADTYDSHMLGQIQRMKDEVALTNANIDPNILNKVGGVSGLLDKVATENPEAVRPAEMQAPVDPTVDPAAMDPAMVDPAAAGAVPAEAIPGEVAPGAEGGEVDEDTLNQVVEALDQAGITPDELAQALQEVAALQEAGVQPEELVQALQQMEQQKQAEDDEKKLEPEETPAREAAEETTEAAEPVASDVDPVTGKVKPAKKQNLIKKETQDVNTASTQDDPEQKTASDIQANRIEAIKAVLRK